MGDFVLFNGFDRSGTSAITRLLAIHSRVELIMQPFNSGFLRKRMYSILEEERETSPEHIFFKGLEDNKLENGLIESHWHYKYSTTHEYKEGQLHIIKTTINHFAQKWMRQNYPNIDVWGVWREPWDIVDSIIRNKYYGEWYEDSLKQIIPTIENTKLLDKYYSKYLNELDSIVKKTSFLVAVRSHFFFHYLKSGLVIDYEEFRKNPNYLNLFLKYYNLSFIELADESSKDLNITGEYKKDKEPIRYSEEEVNFINKLFDPLKALVAKKHNIL